MARAPKTSAPPADSLGADAEISTADAAAAVGLLQLLANAAADSRNADPSGCAAFEALVTALHEAKVKALALPDFAGPAAEAVAAFLASL